LPRRAVCWFAVSSFGMIATVALTALHGPAGHLFALGGWIAFVAVGWVGSIIDLALLSSSRLARVRVWGVAGFVVAVAVVGTAVRVAMRTSLLEAFKIPDNAREETHEIARGRAGRRGRAVRASIMRRPAGRKPYTPDSTFSRTMRG
jgi:hypothetical protein